MSQPFTIESIEDIFLDRSIKNGEKYNLHDFEQALSVLIELIQITDSEKSYLSSLATSKGRYPVDAGQMMKDLGILDRSAYSDKVNRVLERANIIPKIDTTKLQETKKVNPPIFFWSAPSCNLCA